VFSKHRRVRSGKTRTQPVWCGFVFAASWCYCGSIVVSSTSLSELFFGGGVKKLKNCSSATPKPLYLPIGVCICRNRNTRNDRFSQHETSRKCSCGNVEKKIQLIPKAIKLPPPTRRGQGERAGLPFHDVKKPRAQ
jgi:hypothetical protein